MKAGYYSGFFVDRKIKIGLIIMIMTHAPKRFVSFNRLLFRQMFYCLLKSSKSCL